MQAGQERGEKVVQKVRGWCLAPPFPELAMERQARVVFLLRARRESVEERAPW